MLKGKSAIVTGSTSGIGLGIARALADQGARLIFNGLATPDGVRDVDDEFVTGIDALVVVPISQSAAEQRRGRAGSRASGSQHAVC